MRAFIDEKGRQWCINVNVLTLKKLKSLGYDFLKFPVKEDDNNSEEYPAYKFWTDPLFAGEVIFELLRSQTAKHNITEEELAELLRGELLDTARKTFWEDFSDFFPDKGVRESLKKVKMMMEEEENLNTSTGRQSMS